MQEGALQFPVTEVWPGHTPYPAGLAAMEARVAQIVAATAPEAIIFCEHEPVLTLGSSGSRADIGPQVTIPVVETGRGGQVTYHGPGQRVVYLLVRLTHFNNDIRAYVRWLEAWLIEALAQLGVQAFTTADVGVWVEIPSSNIDHRSSTIEKIAAIGVRVRKGVAFHGIALNVTNDLGIYKQFTPCGISDKGVTNLATLVPGISIERVDEALHNALQKLWPEQRPCDDAGDVE